MIAFSLRRCPVEILFLCVVSLVPLNWIEYGVCGDLIITYPYSIYLRGTRGQNSRLPQPYCLNETFCALPKYLAKEGLETRA